MTGAVMVTALAVGVLATPRGGTSLSMRICRRECSRRIAAECGLPDHRGYRRCKAGTNFGVLNDDPPAQNHQSTASRLVTLLNTAGVSWKAYQEGISGMTCPLTNVGEYVVRHDPFVYFDDVTEANNSSAPYCIAH